MDNEEKYMEFLDYMMESLPSADGFYGSVSVEILSTQDPCIISQASRPTVSNTGGATSSAVQARDGPLQRICLRCYLQDGFEEVDHIPVNWTWEQVPCFGLPRYFTR